MSDPDNNIDLEKLDIMMKLVHLVQQGEHISRNYNMSSDINEMKLEYEMLKHEKRKRLRDDHLSKLLLAGTWFLEYLCERMYDGSFTIKEHAIHLKITKRKKYDYLLINFEFFVYESNYDVKIIKFIEYESKELTLQFIKDKIKENGYVIKDDNPKTKFDGDNIYISTLHKSI